MHSGVCNLKDKCSTLSLLLTTQFKVLASFQRQLSSVFALITFQTQHNLLCRFRLTKSAFTLKVNGEIPSCGTQVLFDHRNHSVSCRNVVYPIISHVLILEVEYLSKHTGLAGFVLCDFGDCVFSAVLALAVGTTSLGNVD